MTLLSEIPAYSGKQNADSALREDGQRQKKTQYGNIRNQQEDSKEKVEELSMHWNKNLIYRTSCMRANRALPCLN